jgi:hypothetical protein
VLDYGNPAVLGNKANQAFPAARDDAMNIVVQSKQMIECFAVDGGNELDRVLGDRR